MFTFFILLMLATSNGPSQPTTGDVSGVPNGETVLLSWHDQADARGRAHAD
jgi:hypothetical protein